MRHYLAATALLGWLALFARADDRSLFIVFGSTGEDAGSHAAHSSAATAQQWLQSGATIEVRRPGVSEGQQLASYMQLPDLEKFFLDAARAGRSSDALGFLNTLDKATYALARHAGKRLLLAVVESRSLAAPDAMRGGPEEMENRLSQTLDFCKANSVIVIVLDPDPPVKEPLAALASLAAGTGGAFIRDPNALGTSLSTLAPAEKPAESPTTQSKPAATSAALTIHLRLVRTLPSRVQAGSDMGPMSGLFIVESPFRNLEFQTDDRAGTYQARARVTEVIRNRDGKTAWQAKKEISVKGPLRGLPVRREGNLYYMRQVQLPPGQYVFEATVEDLVSGKSATASEPMRAHDTVPGFDVSDAMFVRKLNDSTDKFEADQVLSYDGKALVPMLAPVFRANQPADLQLYAILYPDLRGGQPDLRLEILRAGEVVGQSQLSFSDQIRNTTTEGSVLDPKGEQKHEFPYIAAIVGASFEAGDYEAHLIVRQGGRTMTRSAPFRVTAAQ
jgi:hypothetical protein